MFSILSLIKVICSIEIVVGEALFSLSFKRKKFFPLRIAITLLLMVCWALFINPISSEDSFLTILSGFYMFLPLWIISVVGMIFSFDEKYTRIFLSAVAGYTVQKISSLVQSYISLINSDILNFTSSNVGWVAYVVLFLTDGLVFTICYFVFARFMNKEQPDEKLTPKNILIILVAALANLLFGLIYTFANVRETSIVNTITSYGQNLICCILILCLLSGIFKKDTIKRELEYNQRIYAIERENYKNEKKMIDIINKKCHDLKHRMLELSKNKEIDLSDISEVINIYDSSIHTNNEALDVVVQQKQLLCKQNNIKLTLMVDASKISFMKNTDIFVMFGNLFDNAINAVLKIEDINRRVITVKIFDKSNLLIIGFENEFNEELIIENGDYKTTSMNKIDHGYGIQSIKEIVKKYNGSISISSEGNYFKTNITFVVNS